MHENETEIAIQTCFERSKPSKNYKIPLNNQYLKRLPPIQSHIAEKGYLPFKKVKESYELKEIKHKTTTWVLFGFF